MAASKLPILITGGTGFIGAHTVNNFLQHGYRLRLVGRNAKSCQKILETHAEYKDLIETVVVPDITASNAFDSAVDSVGGVVHLASPFFHKIENTERDMLLPAIDGTTEILKSVAKHAPEVRRVVITSSIAAIVDFSQGLRPGWVYDESQWDPVTYEQAKDVPGFAYAGSKTFAEKAAWDFVRDNSVSFSLATINPTMVYGPNFPGSASLSHLGQSAGEIYSLMDGSLTVAPSTGMPVFVDVREVAEAHRLAFETKDAGRFALCAANFTKPGVCKLLRDSGLGLEGRVPSQGLDAEDSLKSYSVDSSRAEEVLGIHFRPAAETFLDMAKEFLEMERTRG